MYEIVKNVINSGRFELNDILKKIDTLWVQGDITEEQKTELVNLAREKASPEDSYAPLQEQIELAFNEINALKERVDKLENQDPQPEPDQDPQEEYPPYKQPTGAHDAYNTGDKVTYNGKKYICQMDNCVWSPDTYPAGWKLAE